MKLKLTLPFLFICITISKQQSTSCREARTCNTCQLNPNCGWCATTYACVEGTAKGPTVGNCAAWLWFGCEPIIFTTKSHTSTARFTRQTTKTDTTQQKNITTHTLQPSTSTATTTPPAPFIPPQGNNWWTAFGGDDARTGFKQDTIGAKLTFTLRWYSHISLATAAVVYNGTIYSIDLNGNLLAFNETTGALTEMLNLGTAWKIGPPTIGHHGLLYVQYVGSNEGIFLSAISIDTLKLKWTATGSSQWSSYMYGVASSGINDLVYFPGGEFDGVLYAAADNDGTLVFSSQLYSTGDGCDSWAPTVYQDTRVFFSSGTGDRSNSMVGEVNATDGQVLWQKALNSFWDGYSTYWYPVVANDIVFAANLTGSSVSIVAIDLNIKTVLWKSKSCTVQSGTNVSPATDGSLVFLTCEYQIYAYNSTNGQEVAVYPCTKCFGQAIVTNDYVICNSVSGAQVFDKESTNLIGIALYQGSHKGYIAYHGGWLFLSSQDGLNAYQLLTNLF